MSTGIEFIQRVKEERGLAKVQEALAQHVDNDPYYSDRASRKDWAEWAAEIWKKYFNRPVHSRRIHYFVVSLEEDIKTPRIVQGYKYYRNTEDHWQKLSGGIKDARYLKLIPFDMIIDRKNPEPVIHDFEPRIYCEFEYIKPSLIYEPVKLEQGRLAWVKKPYMQEVETDLDFNARLYRAEIWIEKTTLNDELLPFCEKYGVNLVTGSGDLSLTRAYELITRYSSEKPMRIFYLSDFDKKGLDMPISMSRKIQWLLDNVMEEDQADIKLYHLALTFEQVKELNLPRTPMKKETSGLTAFEEKFGKGGVELDALAALRPDVLNDLLQKFVVPYAEATIKDPIMDLYKDFKNEGSTMVRHDEKAEELQREITKIEDELKERLAPLERERNAIVREYLDQVKEIDQRYKSLWDDYKDWIDSLQDEEYDYSDLLQVIEENAVPEGNDNPLFDSIRLYYMQTRMLKRYAEEGILED